MCRLNSLGRWKAINTKCRIYSAARPTHGAVAAITWNSIRRFNQHTFFWCAAELGGARPAVAPYQCSNLYARYVFERRGHLHPLTALPIITKFLGMKIWVLLFTALASASPVMAQE